MNQFIQQPPWPFGRKPSPFYLCQCPKCGFEETYEVDDTESIASDGSEESSSPKTVNKLPSACPKCGARLKKKHMPDFRKF